MSKFYFFDLTEDVRNFMLDEVNSDIGQNKLFLSPRLTEEGCRIYPDLLQNCIKNGDEVQLQEVLNNNTYIKTQELRGTKFVKVPSTAAQLIAQGEFNRYYIRGLCIKAIENGVESVEIYRARESSLKRPESQGKIRAKINPKLLLDDLRQNIGIEPQILPEINSGLSIKL